MGLPFKIKKALFPRTRVINRTIIQNGGGGGGSGDLLSTNNLDDLDDIPTALTNLGKDSTGGFAGLTLFKINFKNALNTITSFFTNANTVARTYLFQDRDGTIADDTDLALKASLTGVETLTNKRITQRVSSEASNVSPSIDADAVDSHIITALAANMTTGLTWTGTPTSQQKLIISITPTGAVRNLVFVGSKFEESFSQALPTETFADGVRMDITFIYNSVSGKFRCLNVS